MKFVWTLTKFGNSFGKEQKEAEKKNKFSRKISRKIYENFTKKEKFMKILQEKRKIYENFLKKRKIYENNEVQAKTKFRPICKSRNRFQKFFGRTDSKKMRSFQKESVGPTDGEDSKSRINFFPNAICDIFWLKSFYFQILKNFYYLKILGPILTKKGNGNFLVPEHFGPISDQKRK